MLLQKVLLFINFTKYSYMHLFLLFLTKILMNAKLALILATKMLSVSTALEDIHAFVKRDIRNITVEEFA